MESFQKGLHIPFPSQSQLSPHCSTLPPIAPEKKKKMEDNDDFDWLAVAEKSGLPKSSVPRMEISSGMYSDELYFSDPRIIQDPRRPVFIEIQPEDEERYSYEDSASEERDKRCTLKSVCDHLEIKNSADIILQQPHKYEEFNVEEDLSFDGSAQCDSLHSSNATEDEVENLPVDEAAFETDYLNKRFGLLDASDLISASSAQENSNECKDSFKPVGKNAQGVPLPQTPPAVSKSSMHMERQNTVNSTKCISILTMPQKSAKPQKLKEERFSLNSVEPDIYTHMQNTSPLLEREGWNKTVQEFNKEHQTYLEQLHQQWCDKEDLLTQQWNSYIENLNQEMNNKADEIIQEQSICLGKLNEDFKRKENDINMEHSHKLEQCKVGWQIKEESFNKEKEFYFNALQEEWKKRENLLNNEGSSEMERIKVSWKSKEEIFNKDNAVLLEKLNEEWQKKINEFNENHKKDLSSMLLKFKKEKADLDNEYQTSLEKISEELKMQILKDEELLREENINRLNQIKNEAAEEEEAEKSKFEEILAALKNHHLETIAKEKETLSKEKQLILESVKEEINKDTELKKLTLKEELNNIQELIKKEEETLKALQEKKQYIEPIVHQLHISKETLEQEMKSIKSIQDKKIALTFDLQNLTKELSLKKLELGKVSEEVDQLNVEKEKQQVDVSRKKQQVKDILEEKSFFVKELENVKYDVDMYMTQKSNLLEEIEEINKTCNKQNITEKNSLRICKECGKMSDDVEREQELLEELRTKQICLIGEIDRLLKAGDKEQIRITSLQEEKHYLITEIIDLNKTIELKKKAFEANRSCFLSDAEKSHTFSKCQGNDVRETASIHSIYNSSEVSVNCMAVQTESLNENIEDKRNKKEQNFSHVVIPYKNSSESSISQQMQKGVFHLPNSEDSSESTVVKEKVILSHVKSQSLSEVSANFAINEHILNHALLMFSEINKMLTEGNAKEMSFIFRRNMHELLKLHMDVNEESEKGEKCKAEILCIIDKINSLNLTLEEGLQEMENFRKQKKIILDEMKNFYKLLDAEIQSFNQYKEIALTFLLKLCKICISCIKIKKEFKVEIPAVDEMIKLYNECENWLNQNQQLKQYEADFHACFLKKWNKGIKHQPNSNCNANKKDQESKLTSNIVPKHSFGCMSCDCKIMHASPEKEFKILTNVHTKENYTYKENISNVHDDTDMYTDVLLHNTGFNSDEAHEVNHNSNYRSNLEKSFCSGNQSSNKPNGVSDEDLSLGTNVPHRGSNIYTSHCSIGDIFKNESCNEKCKDKESVSSSKDLNENYITSWMKKVQHTIDKQRAKVFEELYLLHKNFKTVENNCTPCRSILAEAEKVLVGISSSLVSGQEKLMAVHQNKIHFLPYIKQNEINQPGKEPLITEDRKEFQEHQDITFCNNEATHLCDSDNVCDHHLFCSPLENLQSTNAFNKGYFKNKYLSNVEKSQFMKQLYSPRMGNLFRNIWSCYNCPESSKQCTVADILQSATKQTNSSCGNHVTPHIYRNRFVNRHNRLEMKRMYPSNTVSAFPGIRTSYKCHFCEAHQLGTYVK